MKCLIRVIGAVFIVILCLVFCACGSTNASRPEKNFTSEIVPNMVECGSANTNSLDGKGVYYYSIDKNTGVVYLSYDAYRRHAITVMLNPDGTPVTADQLGIPVDFSDISEHK